MNKIWLLLVLVVGLFGCASSPIQIDLSESIYGAPPLNTPKFKVTEITITNKAGDGDGELSGWMFSDDSLAIVPEETTKETVETDLRRYLQQRTDVSDEGKRSLRVVIYEADSYRIYSSMNKVAFLGIIYSVSRPDTEFGLNLRVALEVEEYGRIIGTYWFDDVIRIRDKYGSTEDIQNSYKKLIAKYRSRLFSELDSDFLGRYI